LDVKKAGSPVFTGLAGLLLTTNWCRALIEQIIHLFVFVALFYKKNTSYTHSYSHPKLAARFEKIFILASPPQRMSGEPRQAGILPATIGFMASSTVTGGH
jgi:hypothetical protein